MLMNNYEKAEIVYRQYMEKNEHLPQAIVYVQVYILLTFRQYIYFLRMFGHELLDEEHIESRIWDSLEKLLQVDPIHHYGLSLAVEHFAESQHQQVLNYLWHGICVQPTLEWCWKHLYKLLQFRHEAVVLNTYKSARDLGVYDMVYHRMKKLAQEPYNSELRAAVTRYLTALVQTCGSVKNLYCHYTRFKLFAHTMVDVSVMDKLFSTTQDKPTASQPSPRIVLVTPERDKYDLMKPAYVELQPHVRYRLQSNEKIVNAREIALFAQQNLTSKKQQFELVHDKQGVWIVFDAVVPHAFVFEVQHSKRNASPITTRTHISVQQRGRKRKL